MKSLALAAAITLSSCVAPEDRFYEKVFLCNTDKGDSECGTDRAGKPMTCYPGHLLHASDFCAETCDPDTPPNDERFECIDAVGSNLRGALIQRCRPSEGAASCPNGLSCYRTDVLEDKGLCLSTNVCSTKYDCPGSGLTCGSEYAAAIGGSSLALSTDSLHCVQKTCSTEASPCKLADEACLFDSFSSGNVLPDICVPKCDARGRCPPNFSCARKPDHAPDAPDVCVPGVAGTACTKSQDCLLGDCLDTGAGFRVCALSMPCAPNDYCGRLDQPADKFICTEGVPGQTICVNTRPYSGGNCESKCPEGQECLVYSPFEVAKHGDCRTPCSPDGHCEARGGLPYVCVGPNGKGGCYPSSFGLPCSADDDCLKSLGCLAAGFDERSLHNYSPRLCTIECVVDADCDANRLTRGDGFCEEEAGICRRRGQERAPCSRDAQCYSGRCGAEAGCLAK